MQIKYLYAKDNSGGTGFNYVILQTEEVDKHFFKNLGISPDTKIVLEFSAGRVGASCGLNFTRWYIDSSVRSRSQKIKSYLSDILGLYLNSVSDLRELPDNIDLQEITQLYESERFEYLSIKKELDKNYDEGNLSESEIYKKVLYKEKSYDGTDRFVFGIIDSTMKFVYRFSAIHDSGDRIADYL